MKDLYDTINISLESGTELEEVVLTALGLEKKKDDDLTSTTKIEVDGVQRSGESGVLQGMSGKTSGVNITRNSGDPGSGAYIQIRGQNTIFGDISPLIILDGAIISNDNIGGNTAGVVQQSRLNDINPDDIESISVIKGAAAAAIYGTGAANGVLVINTKRGSESPKGWSVNAKTSLSVETINAEWKKQGSWGQGFPGQWVGEEPGTGVFVENTGFSYGDQMSLRSGGADVYDFSGGWFETQDGTRIGSIAQKNNNTNYNQINRDAVFGNGYTYDNSVSFSYNSSFAKLNAALVLTSCFDSISNSIPRLIMVASIISTLSFTILTEFNQVLRLSFSAVDAVASFPSVPSDITNIFIFLVRSLSSL